MMTMALGTHVFSDSAYDLSSSSSSSDQLLSSFK
jgi:hypothetical protein